jgi:hypothetical protein
MSKNSHIGNIVRYPTTGILGVEHPLSVNDVQYMANNGNHCIDEYTQTRINWTLMDNTSVPPDPPLPYSGSGVDGMTWEHALSHIVPWSFIFDPNQSATSMYPATCIARVYGYNDEASDFSVALVMSVDLENFTYSVDYGSHLIYDTGNTTAASSECLIDGIYQLNTDGAKLMMGKAKHSFKFQDRKSTGAVKNATVDMYLVRFSLYVKGLAGVINSMMVREYNGVEAIII